MVKIRRARVQDLERMYELIKELALFERAPEEVTVTMEEFRESGFGENPVYFSFVAEENEKISAFALYYIRYSTWKGQRMYLEDILVTENERGKGIGKLLFDALIQEAIGKKLNGISWQVLDWNIPAINFYKKYKANLDPEWINGSISKEQLKQFNIEK